MNGADQVVGGCPYVKERIGASFQLYQALRFFLVQGEYNNPRCGQSRSKVTYSITHCTVIRIRGYYHHLWLGRSRYSQRRCRGAAHHVDVRFIAQVFLQRLCKYLVVV